MRARREALAERDLDRTYVSGVERGRRNPTVQAVFRLAQGLDTPASDLVRDAETRLTSG